MTIDFSANRTSVQSERHMRDALSSALTALELKCSNVWILRVKKKSFAK